MDELELLKSLPTVKEREWSFLETIGISQKETIMAKLLAYYFDPEEKHGLKDTFIKALLQTTPFLLSTKKKTDLPKFDGIHDTIEKARVITEESTGDNKRIDISIITENLAIAIEFKINNDFKNPLNKYVDQIKKHKKLNYYFVVLTPYWKKPEGQAKNNEKIKDKFVQITLASFINNVKRIISEKECFKGKENSQQFYIYTDFINTIENRGKEITMINNYFKKVENNDVNKEDIDRVFKSLTLIKSEFEKKINTLKSELINEGYRFKNLSKKTVESVILMHVYESKSDIKIRLTLEGWIIGLWDNTQSGKSILRKHNGQEISSKISPINIEGTERITVMEMRIEDVKEQVIKKIKEYIKVIHG